MNTPPLYCPVPWLCCVASRGADAHDFLRRQLTQNPPSDESHFALAAWNDAKGRVRALFRIVLEAEGPLLIAERDGLDAVLGKLRLFVLRSDVTFSRADALEIAAVIGDAQALLASRGIALDGPGAAARNDGLLWLRHGPGLLHVVGPSAELARLGRELPGGTAEHAALAEIRVGLPYVGAALTERYVPQMLNLDRLGAIAFDKGCYPGQEVVARLHHLGSVKRRLERFVTEPGVNAAAPGPGAPVLDAGDAQIGEVVRAAAMDGRVELLAVVQVDAAGEGAFADGENGERLRLSAPRHPH